MIAFLSTPVRFGSANGEIFWHLESSSFGARLAFEDSSGVEPPLIVGGQPGRFITVDALVNHLGLLDLVADRESADVIARFRDRVTRTFGDVELVGTTTSVGRRLLIVGPDRRTIPVRPALDQRTYRFDWGPGRTSGGGSGSIGLPAVDDATLETARVLIGRSWGPVWGSAEELAAQTLAHNHLGRCGPTFSFTANSLCDWLLFDREPASELSAAALLALSDAGPLSWPIADHGL